MAYIMTPQQRTERQAILTLAHYNFEKGLKSHAFFKTQNSSTGDDLVQNTFMKAWLFLVKGGKIETMKAFLYHILNNLIIDEYRKRKNTSLDTLLESGFEPSVDTTEKTQNIFDGKAAMLLMSRLPKKYKDILLMRHKQELTLQEMSSLTGKSRKTIAVQIYRGFAKLKTLYEQKNTLI